MEGVRRRVVTLHSQSTGDEDELPSKEPPSEEGKPEKKEKSRNVDQIKAVARSMFGMLCGNNGSERDVITEEGVEAAIQNLSETTMNPTKSLVRAQTYAALSEGIKGTIRKLLKDCIHSTKCKEV